MAVPFLTSPLLAARTDVLHGFTTRAGGVSARALASLNLAMRAGETPEALNENWHRVAQALHPGLDGRHVALMSQVHGARVLTVNRAAGPLAVVGEADALVTVEKGVILAVRTADCVPVLFAAPGGIGVAHAGWRGTVAGVVPATVRRLSELTSSTPDTWDVVIGPCIHVGAYETGPEVVDALVASGIPPEVAGHRPQAGARLHADLVASVRSQLEAAGVHRIDVVDHCTASNPALYSHRRDGAATGRLAGVLVRCP